MRHQTNIDRATKSYTSEQAYYCTRNDCNRVLWFNVGESIVERPEKIVTKACMECARQTIYIPIDVPDDTIMLGDRGKPLSKNVESTIETASTVATYHNN